MSFCRTQALQEEKLKVEQLLLELLPRSVANKLKAGHQIQPESFDDVTIFFSDIVSFTRISAAGTPIDVIKMLNLMYTMFDDIAVKYDVYKVATIGDAYFVASGVPIRNGDNHAAEICGMALHLNKSIGNLSIPHIPTESLKMRIGIHSGPCVAGVAGVKMPRYLLFGDTVDIASRMESQGESMHIHVSEATADLLQKKGGFSLEKRGRSEIKGLGYVHTYWLNDN